MKDHKESECQDNSLLLHYLPHFSLCLTELLYPLQGNAPNINEHLFIFHGCEKATTSFEKGYFLPGFCVLNCFDTKMKYLFGVEGVFDEQSSHSCEHVKLLDTSL